jgi:Ca2+-binding EF-hand superfamily protein
MEKEIIAEIDKLFKFFDKNGDGKISTEEVLQAMRSVNPMTTHKEA